MTLALIQLFSRDLDRLKDEVNTYKNDETFWKVEKDILNSGGNLTIHLLGNLNHFIGTGLGNTGYVRDREGEFNNKNISRAIILDQIDDTKKLIESILNTLTNEDLQKVYPLKIPLEGVSTEQFLMHLYGHFNYHLGQINYHRRLLEEC